MAGVKGRKAADLGISSELVRSALRTLETEAAGLAALSAAINNSLGEPFVAAVEKIRAASGRVIVTGMGKSGHIGRKIAATFASTGTPAYFVHPGEASHGDLGMITRDDVIVALSWSGETGELRDLIEYAKRFHVALVAVTANAKSTLAEAADVLLLLPQATEACPLGLAPTTSTLIQLALGDALAVALFESHGFTALDFKALHPGGKLGARRGGGVDRNHHRRRPAPTHGRQSALALGRRRDVQEAEDRAARSARGRGAGLYERGQGQRLVRGGRSEARRARARPRVAAHRRRLAHDPRKVGAGFRKGSCAAKMS